MFFRAVRIALDAVIDADRTNTAVNLSSDDRTGLLVAAAAVVADVVIVAEGVVEVIILDAVVVDVVAG